MSDEIQKFYRAIVSTRLGTHYTISFRGDNKQLALDHAQHCVSHQFNDKGGDVFVKRVDFIGREAPESSPDFGRFIAS